MREYAYSPIYRVANPVVEFLAIVLSADPTFVGTFAWMNGQEDTENSDWSA